MAPLATQALPLRRLKAFLLACVLGLSVGPAAALEPVGVRDFDGGWRFALGEADASGVAFDDGGWRAVRLPHDWSVEAPFQEELEGCTGYLPGGVGWYRKRFALDLADHQLAYLVFDGVYNRATVWADGVRLGFQPYGYSPFHYEIDGAGRGVGGEHVVSVKVDHSRYADSRWYTGSGIYRSVKLLVADKLHIPVDGVFVSTPEASAEEALVAIEIEVRNAYDRPRGFSLVTTIEDADGRVVATCESKGEVTADTTGSFGQSARVSSPRLWGLDSPHLYTARTAVVVDGQTVDERRTRFGVRSIRFDRDQGFFLNGEPTPIKGVCLHHDGGLVGAAVPRGVWRRRLLKLMEGGCNAIRTAHNPMSADFLDLCDELGLLVQLEFYDEWDLPKDKRKNQREQSVDAITRGHHEFFQEWAERDLKATMRRDRNHPSIIQWSIGNEIEWTYPRYEPASGYFDPGPEIEYFFTPPLITPDEVRRRYESSPRGEYVLAETAQKLAAWTREMDRSRPVTANCILPTVSHVSGYADALDVVGYSYRRVVYDYARRHFPDKTIMGTENLTQWHEWKAVAERPFVSGLFLWTGIDYFGEADGRWPQKGTASGLLDTAGFDKTSYHQFKTLWSDEPHVYLTTRPLEGSGYLVDQTTSRVTAEDPDGWRRRLWTWRPDNRFWNYDEKETVIAEVYANADRVELRLNGRSLGVKSLSDFPDRVFKWAVPFEAGELEAVAIGGGGRASDSLTTSGPATGLVLEVDRSALRADGRDVAHVTAQLVDERGVPVRNADREVRFEINGPVRRLGVDNGSMRTVERFQSDRVPTAAGRCLLILQSQDKTGRVTVRARSGGLVSDPLTLQIR